MFAHAFFPSSFYAPGYFPPAVRAVETPRTDGGRRPRRRLPEDILREQRMVEEYLASLEAQKKVVQRLERVPARVRKTLAPKVEERNLTEAMVRAASVEQLRQIVEHPEAVEGARSRAKAEKRRRFMALIMLTLDD